LEVSCRDLKKLGLFTEVKHMSRILQNQNDKFEDEETKYV